MAWVYLIVAGGLETLWATTMQLSEGFTKLGYSLLTLGVMAASVLLLAQAMKDAAAENQRAKEAPQEDLDDTAEFAPVDQREDRSEADDGEDEERTSRIDFGELQFGRDYEIK